MIQEQHWLQDPYSREINLRAFCCQWCVPAWNSKEIRIPWLLTSNVLSCLCNTHNGISSAKKANRFLRILSWGYLSIFCRKTMLFSSAIIILIFFISIYINMHTYKKTFNIKHTYTALHAFTYNFNLQICMQVCSLNQAVCVFLHFVTL